ncbi:PHP domain-containing protein [Clostridium oceanicum]|uniref:Histidinol-phosphatase n=1 Tax=Clostridium oceanicum TaxID=1543 RepID=A0ABN1J802_9CLOT
MKTNYHTHTYRCKHAIGKDEEYIENAIKSGIKILAFTEHMPDKKIGDKYRPSYKEFEEYVDTFSKYKEIYKDRIQLLIGLECEFFNENLYTYEKWKKDERIDLLILGNHFASDRKKYFFNAISKEEIILYKDILLEGMDSEYFDIIAHPDLYLANYPKWDKVCKEVAIEICSRAKEKEIPIEVNSQGMRSVNLFDKNRKKYYYPVKKFWEIAALYNNEVVIGGDYHSPLHIEDKYVQLARDFSEKLNLNVIDEIKLNGNIKED